VNDRLFVDSWMIIELSLILFKTFKSNHYYIVMSNYSSQARL